MAALALLSPVVERELRVALHRRDARKARSRVARLGVLGVSLFLLFGALAGTKSWGGTLNFYLLLGGLGLAVGPAVQISVGLFVEEREQQTLELLYLTGMGSAELFIGKVLGGALVSSCELMALAPVMAVPFLSGGLSFDLFLATVACLPTVFALVLAAGSLASVLCQQEGTALVIAGVLLGALSLALPVPYNLGFWLTGATPFAKSWLVLSPALGPWMVARNFAGFSVSDFWAWTLVTWAWTAAGLALAAVILKRNWRRDLERAVVEGWRAKWAGLHSRKRRVAGILAAAAAGGQRVSMAGRAGPAAGIAGVGIYGVGVRVLVARLLCLAACVAQHAEFLQHGNRAADGDRYARDPRRGAPHGSRPARRRTGIALNHGAGPERNADRTARRFEASVQAGEMGPFRTAGGHGVGRTIDSPLDDARSRFISGGMVRAVRLVLALGAAVRATSHVGGCKLWTALPWCLSDRGEVEPHLDGLLVLEHVQ